MQFKRQKGRIQILAYRGYDKVKRRSVVRMLGSIDAYTYEPSDGLLDKLSDEERAELQEYIEKQRQASQNQVRQYTAKSIASRINEAADAIRSGDFEPSDEWAADVWSAVEALTKAVRKSGYPPPKKPRKGKAPPKAETAPPSLPLPLGEGEGG